MERVDFITVESGDDLIVSFAIGGDDPGEIRSLTLLRTPEYEFALDESERGVSVSDEGIDQEDDDDTDLLQSVELYDDEVRIVCRNREYRLDLQFVCEEEMNEAKKVLNLMNSDRHFGLFGA